MRSFLIALLLVSACKKEKAQDKAAPTPALAVQQPTAAQDALWKLAPAGATFGAVATPSAVGRAEAAWVAVKKLIDIAPELADVKATVEGELTKTLGTPNVSLAALGMSADKGFAAFVINDDRDNIVLVLPVTDRDKFLAVTKGQKGTGAAPDTIKALTCKTVQSVYACARQPAQLDALGKGAMADKLTLVGARGDVELAGNVPGAPVSVAAVMQLERGAFVVRGAVKGVPEQLKQALATAAKPRVEANSVGFAILDLRPLAQAAALPPIEIAPGVTIADLGKTLAGPITITADAGATIADIRVPLSDEAPAKKLVEQCKPLGKKLKAMVTLDAGVCHISLALLRIELDVWVANKELRIGKKTAPAPGPKVEMSKIGSEIANGEWATAAYGRGTLAGMGTLAELVFAFGSITEKAKKGFRMFSLANEIGVAARMDGDVLRLVATVRTVWSNPDDVVAKFAAAPIDDLLAKPDTAKAIATAHANTPFATDVAAGYTGLLVPAALVGVWAIAARAAPGPPPPPSGTTSAPPKAAKP